MSADRKPSWKPIAAVAALLALALFAAACAAYRHQHAMAAHPAAGPARALPVAPASADFKALSDPDRGARLRGEAEMAKASLATQGEYRCCVRPSCDECLLKRGHCHCRDIAAKGGPCCGECTEAWVQGHGVVEGIDAVELLRTKVGMLDEGAPPR
jgi:hypothetical protein